MQCDCCVFSTILGSNPRSVTFHRPKSTKLQTSSSKNQSRELRGYLQSTKLQAFRWTSISTTTDISIKYPSIPKLSTTTAKSQQCWILSSKQRTSLSPRHLLNDSLIFDIKLLLFYPVWSSKCCQKQLIIITMRKLLFFNQEFMLRKSIIIFN